MKKKEKIRIKMSPAEAGAIMKRIIEKIEENPFKRKAFTEKKDG